MNLERSERIEIPVLPLRDVVVYPTWSSTLCGAGKIHSLSGSGHGAGQEKSCWWPRRMRRRTNRWRNFSVGEPVANILQMLKLPDGTVKVLVEGAQRARLERMMTIATSLLGGPAHRVRPIEEKDQDVLVRSAIGQFEGYIKLNKKIPPEVLTSISAIDDAAPGRYHGCPHAACSKTSRRCWKSPPCPERIEF